MVENVVWANLWHVNFIHDHVSVILNSNLLSVGFTLINAHALYNLLGWFSMSPLPREWGICDLMGEAFII